MPNKVKTISSNLNLFPDPSLIEYFNRVREDSERIAEPLEIEDYGIQTVPEVSPPKWHLAHTAWFFETLLLKPYLKGYKEFHPLFNQLFNSYYDTIGAYHARPERGLLSRPTVKEVYQYRAYIDQNMLSLLQDEKHPRRDEIVQRSVLGLNHEQQHQELMLTDIKHIFAYNPLKPNYQQPISVAPANPAQNKPVATHSQATTEPQATTKSQNVSWITFSGGVREIGNNSDSFFYDNEAPTHSVYLNDFKLASRPVTNREYLQFMNDGGYKKSSLWLSDAWKIIKQQQWSAPLYWEKRENEWWYFTLSGMCPVDLNAPVCHVSFYEAAAFARYANKRLPTEAEWEIAARTQEIQSNFRASKQLQPMESPNQEGLQQLYGDVWEWTQSAYSSYPGYRQAAGPLGEYNGKFMSSQMVLRGGSCVTPVDHIRATYRNFFYPSERWQFSGFRLAEDI